jgi:hypothetical protein
MNNDRKQQLEEIVDNNDYDQSLIDGLDIDDVLHMCIVAYNQYEEEWYSGILTYLYMLHQIKKEQLDA